MNLKRVALLAIVGIALGTMVSMKAHGIVAVLIRYSRMIIKRRSDGRLTEITETHPQVLEALDRYADEEEEFLEWAAINLDEDME